MKKVKLIKGTRGGTGNMKPGTVIEVSDSEAKLLIQTGTAVAIPTRRKKKR